MTILTDEVVFEYLKNRINNIVLDAEHFRRRFPRSPVYMSDPEPDRLEQAYELQMEFYGFQEPFEEYTSAWEQEGE